MIDVPHCGPAHLPGCVHENATRLGAWLTSFSAEKRLSRRRVPEALQRDLSWRLPVSIAWVHRDPEEWPLAAREREQVDGERKKCSFAPHIWTLSS